MAACNRLKEATYQVHETVRVDTSDNEDHTFCGIMFPIQCKAILPVDKIIINAIAIRGQLGHITVWVTNDDECPDPTSGSYRIRLTSRHWTKVYEATHPPSQREYQQLDLTMGSPGACSLCKPVILRPGQIRALYIHSTLAGDEAIVYDNSDPAQQQRTSPRYQDSMIAILSGRAHLSPTPFGQMPIWGWGNAWRDRREFVGQIQYGAVYQLWNPELYPSFGGAHYKKAVMTLLLLQRCRGASASTNDDQQQQILSSFQKFSPIHILPDECLFYILNMCRWDWFGDTADSIYQEQRAYRLKQRKLRSQLAAAAAEARASAAAVASESVAATAAEQPPAVAPAAAEPSTSMDPIHILQACAIASGDDSPTSQLMEDVENKQHATNTKGNESDNCGGSDENQAESDTHVVSNDGSNNNNDEDHNMQVADDNNNNNGGGDDDEDDDDGDSDESTWERANGYRADTTAFSYGPMSSDEDEDEDDDTMNAPAGQQRPPQQRQQLPFYTNILSRAWGGNANNNNNNNNARAF